MTLIFFVLLVGLKIVAGLTLIVFWLWIVRDVGMRGGQAFANYAGVFLFWLAPWALFLWHESTLYAGHCGLRQGLHECGLPEFLWTRVDWVSIGMLLDVVLFAGIMVLMLRAHVARRSSPT